MLCLWLRKARNYYRVQLRLYHWSISCTSWSESTLYHLSLYSQFTNYLVVLFSYFISDLTPAKKKTFNDCLEGCWIFSSFYSRCVVSEREPPGVEGSLGCMQYAVTNNRKFGLLSGMRIKNSSLQSISCYQSFAQLWMLHKEDHHCLYRGPTSISVVLGLKM